MISASPILISLTSLRLCFPPIWPRGGGGNLLAEKKRKAWKQLNKLEARCEFRENLHSIILKDKFYVISLWRKSTRGKTLTDIKLDERMPEYFASNLSVFMKKVLGTDLDPGHWAVITAPKRRHKERNFATIVSVMLAERLGLHFYEDLLGCRTRNRLNQEFHFNYDPPAHRQLIVFDDILTTGSTMSSIYRLMAPMGYNLTFFAGILNK